jgi:hypothetical protein
VTETQKPLGFSGLVPAPLAGETISDFRTRVAQHQAELQEQRQRELFEQSAERNSAAVRIGIWERLHQLRMPRDSSHRLIGVIAADTGLSIDEVREELRQRLAPKPTPAT